MEPGFPVWTIRPNWRQGITERLEWLTDVMTAASSGAEQRRALRLSPRRFIEIVVNPTKQERTFLDLMMHRNGSATWLFPLWFDVASLSAPAVATETRVEFDTTFREHGLGGYALLLKDAFTWEVISITGHDDDGLDLSAPLDADWPAGTKVFPLRFARLPIETSLSALTTQVGEAVIMFQVAQANDFVEVEPTDVTFEGVPVLMSKPNRSQEITLDHIRLASELDNSTAIPYRSDPVNRAFQVQGHNWMIRGREAHAQFRSFLYWLRGRQRALWVPSFNEDVVAARSSALASTNLDVQKIGMAYAGGVVPGRDVIIINGTPARITDLGVPLDPAEERLRIGAGLTAAIPAGATGSFLSMCRLNQDAVELTHHTDTDGVMEVAASFQSFSDTRDPSGTIYNPIPTSAKNSGPCGFSFLLANPGFEMGDMTGWTITSGGFNVIQSLTQGSNITLPHSGSYFAIGTTGMCSFYQEVVIPTRFLAKVDEGIATFANFAAYQNSGIPLNPGNPSNNDAGRLYVSFRDATDVELLRVYSAWNYNFEWVRMNAPDTVVPVGTRRIRVGTENDPEDSVTDSMWDSFDQPVLVFGA